MTLLNKMGLWGQMASVFVFSFLIYAHDLKELNGPWILDDKGTVSMNPAVTFYLSRYTLFCLLFDLI
jgi:hypothetical protein